MADRKLPRDKKLRVGTFFYNSDDAGQTLDIEVGTGGSFVSLIGCQCVASDKVKFTMKDADNSVTFREGGEYQIGNGSRGV